MELHKGFTLAAPRLFSVLLNLLIFGKQICMGLIQITDKLHTLQ